MQYFTTMVSRKVKYALGGYVDVIPEYEQMNKPKELFFRYKANVCEMCGAYVPAVKVYQVKSMSDLDVNTDWGAIMNKKKMKNACSMRRLLQQNP